MFTAMFAVISRCVAHSFVFISLITAEDALKADVWLNDDHAGDNLVTFSNVPTMQFSQPPTSILRFSAFNWVYAEIIGTRSPASNWRYGSMPQLLPPRPLTPTTRTCEVHITTAPSYTCTGFSRNFTPVLARTTGPAHPRTVNIPGDMFEIGRLHRQLRTRHIHVTLREWDPYFQPPHPRREAHQQPRGEGDGGEGGRNA